MCRKATLSENDVERIVYQLKIKERREIENRTYLEEEPKHKSVDDIRSGGFDIYHAFSW